MTRETCSNLLYWGGFMIVALSAVFAFVWRTSFWGVAVGFVLMIAGLVLDKMEGRH